jgi:hypothetical protein
VRVLRVLLGLFRRFRAVGSESESLAFSES